jgi:hypothetical protein
MMWRSLHFSLLFTCFLLAVLSQAYGQDTEVLLSADSVSGLPGTEVIVPVRVKGFDNVITCQGTIAFDPGVVALVGVEQYGLTGMGAANFGTTRKDNGELLFSWDDAALKGRSLAGNAVLFALRFKVTGGYGTSSRIRFVDAPTPLEFAGKDFIESKFELKTGKVQVAASAIFTLPVEGSAFCAGSTIQVAFATQDTFGQDNTFTVQLSDASGSFLNAADIGKGSSSPVVAVLSAAAAEGTGYRLRVTAVSPAVAGRTTATTSSFMLPLRSPL